MSDIAPVKIKLRPVPYYIVGGALLVCALCCLLVSIAHIRVSGDFGTAFWITIGALAFLALPSIWFLGVALKRPVALRIDENGVSGFYADPATWHEIDQINVIPNNKGKLVLAFALNDPVGFRDRQSPWRRFTYWSNGRAYNHQIIVPHMTLKKGEAAQLVVKARHLKDAATS